MLAAAVSQWLARESLERVGYSGEAIDTTRPWWVELYDYGYGLTWARRIASQVAPATLPDKERVAHLATWVFDHFIGNNLSMPVQEDHFFNTARRGYGYCDQLAHVLATLYWSAGYPSRLLMLRNLQGVSIHTVTEVRVQGRWVVVDPYFRMLPQTPEGRLAGVEDIVAHPELLQAYRKEGMVLTPAEFQRGTVFTTAPYASFGQLLERWASWSRQSRQPHQRFSWSAQRAKTSGGLTLERRAETLRVTGIRRLDRARRCELWGEDRQAQALYTDLMRDTRVPENVRTIVIYWLARLAWRTQDPVLCRNFLGPLLRSSTVEEGWRLDAVSLQDRCTAMLEKSWVTDPDDGHLRDG